MKRGKKKASGDRPTCYRNRGPSQMKMPGYLDVLAWALQVVLYTPSTHTAEVESSRSWIAGCGFLGYIVHSSGWVLDCATSLPTYLICSCLAWPSFYARKNKEILDRPPPNPTCSTCLFVS